jgi:branched-chain amino acid transport system permease protein
VASGLTLIFGVLRIINFAHGAVMMLGMYASYWLWVWLGVDPYLSVLLTAPAFFVLGMGIQRLVIEPNRQAAEHNQLLLTLASRSSWKISPSSSGRATSGRSASPTPMPPS